MEEDQGGQNKSQRSQTGIHQNVLRRTKASGTNETKLEIFSQSIWLWKGTITVYLSVCKHLLAFVYPKKSKAV